MQEVAAKRRTHETEASADEKALSELFATHADFVWRSLRRLGVAPADTDDALQEVFLVVFRRLSEYEERGLVRAWLFTICRQIASHYHRGNTRAENRQQGLTLNVPGTDLEESLARREAERIVCSFLEQLEEPQRMVFYLADIEGMTAPEIAAALKIKLNTVYGRLRLARKRFELAIAKHSSEEFS